MNLELFTKSVLDGINNSVAKRDLDNMASEYWMDDAGIDETQARVLLTDIFTARHMAGMLQLIELPEYADMNPAIANHKFIAECIKDSEDFTWEQAVEDSVSSAMTYYCMDHWDAYWKIIENVNQLDWITKDVYGKAVSYLYDYYTPEEETA